MLWNNLKERFLAVQCIILFSFIKVIENNEESKKEDEVSFLLPVLLPFISYGVIILFTSMGWNFANRFFSGAGGLQLTVDAKDPEVAEEYEIDSNLTEQPQIQGQKRPVSNNKYFLTLCLITIFYSLPVFQFVLRYLEKDETNCCFNDDCIQTYLGFKDFGGLYSNIGYVVMGFAFLGFVYHREQSFNRITTMDVRIGVTHGTFLNFGIFNALGFALIAQGLFSGGYHICPNKQNFQFDTSFMYAMALLGYVVIYQMRHKRNSPNAEIIVFMALAVLVLSAAIGLVVTDGLVFGILFTAVYIVGIILVHYQWLMYNNKRIHGENFGTRILIIALGNLISRCIYYLFMKCQYRESEKYSHKCWQPMIYLGLASIFWISGIIYFVLSPVLWDEKQAPGVCIKKHIQECIISIYDVHDIWHFLSALGLFFSFMMLLTIDDHIIGKSRKSIEVF